MSAAIARLGLPLVVKPPAVGPHLACRRQSADELPPAMVAAFAYGDGATESFCGRDRIAVSVIESPEAPSPCRPWKSTATPVCTTTRPGTPRHD
jgi:hypothetical protein